MQVFVRAKIRPDPSGPKRQVYTCHCKLGGLDSNFSQFSIIISLIFLLGVILVLLVLFHFFPL